MPDQFATRGVTEQCETIRDISGTYRGSIGIGEEGTTIGIPFRLSQSSEVRLQIYEATGRLVRSIQVGYLEAGVYENRAKAVYWDGRNDMGERVASGIYFYSFESGKFKAVKKLAVSK